METMKEPYTLYLILFYVHQSRIIKVGAMGNVYLVPGYYVYAGSAKQNMSARLKRHRTIRKTKRWHLDYLRPALKWQWSMKCRQFDGECALVGQLRQHFNTETVQKKLGSTDCKCDTHFLKLNDPDISEQLATFVTVWNCGTFTKS